MANPLIYKGNGTIQAMVTSEVNNLANAVLESFATINGPGSIYTSNVGNAAFTLIGSFTDTTYQGNVGESDLTILSTEYDLFQDLQTPTGDDPPKPIVHTSNTAPLQMMTSSQLNSLADTILAYSVSNEGPGSYRLASSTPGGTGTWVNLGQMIDVFTGATQSSKYLYKKTDAGAYTDARPLKYTGSGNLQSFTDSDITLLTKVVRQRIVNTGVGQYKFQATTPSPGTWTNVGSIVDTRPDTSVVNYSTDYQSSYVGTDSYTADYSGSYVGDAVYDGNLTSYNATAYYDGESSYVRTTSHTDYNYYASVQGFAGTAYYLNEDSVFPTAYTGIGYFDGASYTGSIANAAYFNVNVNYTGVVYYGGITPIGYVSNPMYTGAGPLLDSFTLLPVYFTSVVYYTGPGSTNYQGGFDNTAAYTSAPIYSGPDITQQLNFTSITYYLGPVTYTNFTTFSTPTSYLGPGTFSGPVAYIGPKGIFTGGSAAYVGPADAISFAGAAVYTGPTRFTNPDKTAFGVTNYYQGPNPAYFLGYQSNAYFTGTGHYESPASIYTGGFTGFSTIVYKTQIIADYTPYQATETFIGNTKYLSPLPAIFTGQVHYTGPSPVYYAPTFSSQILYATSRFFVGTEFFAGVRYYDSTQSFSGPSYFVGPATFTNPLYYDQAYYTGQDYYEQVYSTPYALDTSYEGSINTINYAIDTVGGGSQNITEIILWRRIA